MFRLRQMLFGCVLTLFGWFVPALRVAAASPQEMMYESYLTGDMQQWSQALNLLMQQRLAHPNFNNFWHEALARYGYAGFFMETKQPDKAREMIDAGWKLIEKMQEMAPQSGPLFAMNGAYYELEIALSPYKSAYYGPKLMLASNRSMSLSPIDAYCLAERALYLWHVPDFVGGDRQEALKLYEQAILAMELQNRQNEWYYLHVNILLAKAFESSQQLNQARDVYEKLLRLAPGFKRVRDILYPRLMSKIRQNK